MPCCCCCCHSALWCVKPSLMIPLWSVVVQGHYSEYPLQETFSIIFRSVEEIYRFYLIIRTPARPIMLSSLHVVISHTLHCWALEYAFFLSFLFLNNRIIFPHIDMRFKAIWGKQLESYNMNGTLTPRIIFIFNGLFLGENCILNTSVCRKGKTASNIAIPWIIKCFILWVNSKLSVI